MMPKRPPIACTCGGVRRDDVCDRCGKGFGKRRPSAAKRGYGADWRKARRLFLKDNPFCVKCPRESKVVDHIEPHRGDMVLFWMRSNWQALCERCHNAKTGAGE